MVSELRPHSPNEITGANAGGSAGLPIRALTAARIAQCGRSAYTLCVR